MELQSTDKNPAQGKYLEQDGLRVTSAGGQATAADPFDRVLAPLEDVLAMGAVLFSKYGIRVVSINPKRNVKDVQWIFPGVVFLWNNIVAQEEKPIS